VVNILYCLINIIQFDKKKRIHIFFFIQGTLKGFDQTINIILDDSHERVYSPNQGVEQIILGLHLIRGDNV